MGLEHVRAGHWRGDVEHLVLDDRGGRVRLVQILEDGLAGVGSNLGFFSAIYNERELRTESKHTSIRFDLSVTLMSRSLTISQSLSAYFLTPNRTGREVW